MAVLTCPSCGGDKFEVQVVAWAPLVEVSGDCTPEPPGHLAWTHDSRARCAQCGLDAPLREFREWRCLRHPCDPSHAQEP